MKTFFKLILTVIFLSSQLAFAAMSNPPTSTEKSYLSFANQLTNPGFESGLTGFSWTTTAPSTTTTNGEVFDGSRALKWNAAGSDKVCSSSWSVKENAGGNGVAFARFKTSDSDYDFEVQDGSGNVVVTEDIPATGEYVNVALNFVAAESTSYKACIVSSADNDDVFADNFGIGYAEGYNLGTVAQAAFFGSIEYVQTANCSWSTTSTTFANFSADTDCPAPTVTGNASAPSTKIPGITFSSLPAGEYLFVSSGRFTPNSTTVAAYQVFQFNDATNSFGSTSATSGGGSSGDASSSSSIIGRINYTQVQSNITIQVQAKTSSGSNAAVIDNADASRVNHFEILVYRFPLASQQVHAPDIVNWRVDANIGGANIDLGTSSQASYITPNNASLTLTQNSGSAPVGISCSSTNDNTVGSTTCSAGSEEPGIVVDIPRSGDIEVCFDFSGQFGSNNGGEITTAFQVVRTANGSQTVAAEGKNRAGSRASISSGTVSVGNSFNNCGTFGVSTGKNTFRLMYEQLVSGTISSTLLADGSTSVGQRDIHVTARYIDQNTPAPNIVNSVVTKYQGVYGLESAHVSSADAVSGESGDWINGNCTNATTGKASCTINSGVFSADPICVCVPDNGANQSCRISSSSSTSVVVDVISAGSLSDGDFNLICHGPR